VHGGRLKPRCDDGGLLAPEHAPERAIHHHAHEGDDLGPDARDLGLEDLPSLEIFRRPQVVDPRARPRDQVRHAEAPLRQPHVPFGRDGLRDDARLEQQLPEAIRRPCEVMARLRRAHAGVDAHEQHADARLDPVRQPHVGPPGFKVILDCRLAIGDYTDRRLPIDDWGFGNLHWTITNRQ